MSKTYSSIGALLQSLEKDINSSLTKEVFQSVKKSMGEHIRNDVYKVYKPRYYSRRNELSDTNNIICTKEGNNRISITTIAQPSRSIGKTNGWTQEEFIRTIEMGKFKCLFGTNQSPYNKARPFIKNTSRELEKSGSHTKALKKGLTSRGWNVIN